MMSNLKILIVYCLTLGFAHSLAAMEQIPSCIPNLYQMTLKKLSQQDDVDILIAALHALPDEFAWDLVEEVLESNFQIGSHGNARVLAAFQKRPNLSRKQKEGLELLETKALSGNLRCAGLATVLQEIRVEFKKSNISSDTGARVWAEGPTKRAEPEGPDTRRRVDKEKIFNLSQKVDYDLAKMYLKKWQSIEMVNELLYAVLVANFSLNWVQKCALISIVRDRHEATNPADCQGASSMEAFLDRVEALMLRGFPLHGLSAEELKALQAPDAQESSAIESQ
jgi:hypothetical protein